MTASGTISEPSSSRPDGPNAFTVDVEDYYAIMMRDRLGAQIAPTEAVVRNTRRVLNLLAGHGVKATFFVLGEVAAAHPALVRDIAAAGHEIGVHGFYHRQFFKLTRQQLAAELGNAKKLLEDLAGQPAHGHRAPAFSVRPDTLWGLEVLVELGFRYDSSIFPIRGRRYGWADFGPDIRRFELPNGSSIIEAPMSTVRVLGRTLPACGGGYLRHFPYWFTRWAMRRIQRIRPAVVYMHPYEIDLEPGPAEFQAALSASPRSIRHLHRMQLRNRRTVFAKLHRLLDGFRFAPLGEIVATATRE